MRTQYYTATSLDGFIATEDDSLEWLFPLADPAQTSYPAFIEQVGALAMGASTYLWLEQHLAQPPAGQVPEPWPYTQPAWVFTHHALPRIEGADVRFVDGDVRPVHAAMQRAAGGRNLWIVGGGELAGQFFDAGLLDELIVQVGSVTLGAGKPLLPRRIPAPRAAPGGGAAASATAWRSCATRCGAPRRPDRTQQRRAVSPARTSAPQLAPQLSAQFSAARAAAQRRTSRIRLNGVSAARRKRVNPALRNTSVRRFSPACAPSTSCAAFGDRVRAADRGRGRVVQPRDRRDVVLDAIVRERLDQHDRAVGREHLGGVARRGDRVAHVVQAVEEADESVVAPRIVGRTRGGKVRARGHARLLGVRARRRDRFGVHVEAAEARVRKGLGHLHGRVAVAATDVGHRDAGAQLLDHAVERRQPLGQQAGAVGVAIERRHAAEQAAVVVAPGHALAAAERLERLVLVEPHRGRRVPGVRDVQRAVLVGQHQRLLRRQFVGVADRVVRDVAARRLRVEPLAHVARRAAGARSELVGAQRSGAGHGLVQAELGAEADHHAAVAGGEVADGAHDEGVELGSIDHGCIHGSSFLVS